MCRKQSPGSENFTVVVACPEYGCGGLPPVTVSNRTVLLVPMVIVPGPRYFVTRGTRIGRPSPIGPFPPLLNCASSSAHNSSGIGVLTVAVRSRAFDMLAYGPENWGPPSVSFSTGGLLYSRVGLSSVDLVGVML